MALFYIFEFTKWKTGLLNFSAHYSFDQIQDTYFQMKNLLRQRYFDDPNCLDFTYADALQIEEKPPAEVVEAYKDDEKDDSLQW